LTSPDHSKRWCSQRRHCKFCRSSSSWRFDATGIAEFPCPEGITEESFFLPVLASALPGYGTRFHSMLLEKYGIPACKPCFDQVERMNKMSFDEAVAEKRSILESIWTRKDDAPGWRALAARLPFAKHAAFYELGKIYDEAIQRGASR